MENKICISKMLKDDFDLEIQSSTLDAARISSYKDQWFDFDVFLPSIGENLQRDFVWSLHEKNEFILSIFKRIKIMPVSILQSRLEDNRTIMKVIDGKQRISTYLDFIQNKFKFKFRGVELFYDEMCGEDRQVIRSFRFDMLLAWEWWDKKVSDEQLIKWFDMLNFAGVGQNSEHIEKLKRLSVDKKSV